MLSRQRLTGTRGMCKDVTGLIDSDFKLYRFTDDLRRRQFVLKQVTMLRLELLATSFLSVDSGRVLVL